MAKKKQVNVVPWLELNRPTGPSVERLWDGAKYWRKIARTMIVSTMPGQEQVLSSLRGTGMELIPGIKTWPVLDRFDSIKGWRKVAQSVNAILKHCPDTKEVLLECETAVSLVWRGREKVDFRRLRRAIGQLPRRSLLHPLRYRWWPTYAGHTYAVHDRYFAVAEVVADALAYRQWVGFIDRRLASPDAPADVWMWYAKERLKVLQLQKGTMAPIPLIWCGGAKRPKDFWSYKQVPSVLKMVEGREAILFPGAKNWVEAAKALSGILPARRRRRG